MIAGVERGRRGLRDLRKSFEVVKEEYRHLVNFNNLIGPGNFEDKDFVGILAQIFTTSDFISKSCGEIDSRFGQSIHKIEKGEQDVVIKTVKRVEVGDKPTAVKRKSAAVD